ncbi:MAG: chromate transporter [Oscillospiraceae bacterium]|nr:chromate transporter [Oscillospiraceae bacterium]
MRTCLELFVAFFKMGAVTFGGGYTMLPILKREVAEKKGWVDYADLIDFYAISQGLPGIIAINVSIFIGYRVKRVAGGIAAAFGCVAPSVIIITILAMCMNSFQENLYVQYALHGIAVCVAALIFSAVMDMWGKGIKDILGIIIFILVFIGTEFTDISPIFFIIASAAVGVLARFCASAVKARGTGNDKC